MKRTKIISEITCYLSGFVMVIYCCMLVAEGNAVKGGIAEAVSRCVNIIIPSLFAFMAVSSLLINSGLYRYVSKPLAPFSKYLLGIPPELFFVFLMGNISGYPMGIKMLSDMVKEGRISQRTAEITAVSCCGGGPAFFTGTIGLAVFGSTRIGLIIFLSSLSANFIMAFITGHIFRPSALKSENKIRFTSQVFTDSVLSAGKSLFTICLMIVFFSTCMTFADITGVFSMVKKVTGCSDNILALVKSVVEITSVTQLDGNSYGLLPAVSAVCSFGGICVMVQITAVCKGSFSLRYFFLTRPLNALMSALICFLLKSVMLPDYVPASVVSCDVLVNFNNFMPSFCLIMMILLLNLKKRIVFSKGLCYNKKQ